MSSVSAGDPRRDAAASIFFARRDEGARPEKAARPSESGRTKESDGRESPSEVKELRLIGSSEDSARTPAGPRGAVHLKQLAVSPLALYLVTAIVVAATGYWVVSDISRRHRPIERPGVAAPVAAPIAGTGGPSLAPPARLGDGVVASATASSSASPTDTLNALMLGEKDSAPVEPPGRENAPASVESPGIESAPAPSETARSEIAPPIDAPQLRKSAPDAPTESAGITAPPAAAAPVANDETSAASAPRKCLLKVNGKVLFQGACSADKTTTRATLRLGDKTLVVSLLRGETWQATFGGKSLGAVYPSDDCWGRKKQVYVCVLKP